ncbi:hypothetical protein GCK32_004729 [Trichostrongylus colubriformis]|uniref:Claspin n=1 Tax=Trichostrongylus colubriformis TaxID=6319 RepID=A0AAN8FAZ3_TRICO
MDVDTALDDSASQASNTSASSMTIQYSAGDLQENTTALIANSTVESVRSEGKIRRLNRRLALANLQLPKLTASQDSVIDLRTEEDKLGDISWLRKKFPSIKTDVAKTDNTVCNLPANAPHSIAIQKSLKQSLEKKLAERRRAGLAKRKELYLEDNEGILEDDDEEEECGDDSKKKSKTKKQVRESEESDGEYSADDEEEEPETDNESSQNSETKCGAVDDLPESVDLFDGASVVDCPVKDSQRLHDEESVFSHHRRRGEGDKVIASTTQCQSGKTLLPVDSLNLMLEDDGDTESTTTGMTQPQFPNSLSQWVAGESSDEAQTSVQTPEYVNVGSFSDLDPFKDSCDDDVLMFCSGRFETQNLATSEKPAVEDDQDDSLEDSNQITSTCKRKRALIESDEEDEAGSGLTTTGETSEPTGLNIVEDKAEVSTPATLHRTRVLSDSEDSIQFDDGEGCKEDEEHDRKEERVSAKNDDDGSAEDNADDDGGDGDDYDTEEEGSGEHGTEGKGSDYFDEEAADSDDELAVIRKLEKSEFERKAHREKWFDDEASLSGDDVGSDLDEDGDIPNEYEVEEGDNDDVPDSDVIRRQNHKLLLKQEKDREHKELVKLQDRLLADGDLGGSETNRTFRLKLREDVTVVEAEEGDVEGPEEEQDDESSQARARRVEAIKWLIEHEGTIKESDDKEEEDIFDVAARSVHISTEISANMVSKAPRSLLGQPSLANVIKEVAGVSNVKQLYVNSTPVERKRSSSPSLLPAKKGKTMVSVLGVLEHL